ncbi:MAG: 30S ribosomal protein S17 [Patescibacteria group bacterium]|nr:30S ribosomal protein S17 [Patescibacteria group bacterium]
MKKLTGTIVSDKMNKTAVVEVIRLRVHPLYKKRIKIKKKYHVDNSVKAKTGDKVVIVETRPISKTKKHKILEVIEK